MAFAVIFRSNTHTQPNHRLPITAATHAEECKREQCLIEAKSLKTICKIAQRTQRNATGYYCGYTFKAQVAGKKELSASAESLNYIRTRLENKTAGQQCTAFLTAWCRTCSKDACYAQAQKSSTCRQTVMTKTSQMPSSCGHTGLRNSQEASL